MRNYEKSAFKHNEPCPKCRENGEDRAGDNLARYSDGSGYCWKCKYIIVATDCIGQFLSKRNSEIPSEHRIIERKIHLPDDCQPTFTDEVLAWINQYELSESDLLNVGALYSHNGIEKKHKNERIKLDRLLCFPFWDKDNLLGYQARVFGSNKDKGKWYSKGDVQTIVNILFCGRVGQAKNDASRLVLTEDVISAMKVSKVGIQAMPLFGVNIKSRIGQFRVLNPLELIIFLDPNMHKHSLIEAATLRLNGFKVHTILSDKDPKEYSYNELKELLK